MSGGPHHPQYPFTSQQPNQHDSYAPYLTDPSQSSPLYPSASYNYPTSRPLGHPHGSVPAVHTASFDHGSIYSNAPQPGHFQQDPNSFAFPSAYPSVSAPGNDHVFAHSGAAGFARPLSDFNSPGGHAAAVNHVHAQHLQPGHWDPSAASPASFDGSLHSNSPQPAPGAVAAYGTSPVPIHDQYQYHHSPFNTPAYPETASALPLKQESGLNAITTPPLHTIKPTPPSPQKALRIKIKRTVKAIETDSGGQQAQAQLQIEPDSNMPVGRPSRAAAAAASANINAYSDSPTGRSLRSRPVKQQPGSEEDYEEVSPSRLQISHDHGGSDDYEGKESARLNAVPPSQFYEVQKGKKVNKGKAVPDGKKMYQNTAPKKGGGAGKSDYASGSSHPARPRRRPQSVQPVAPYHPLRRSNRLSTGPQPASSQESVFTPSPPLGQSVDLYVEAQGRQPVSACSSVANKFVGQSKGRTSGAKVQASQRTAASMGILGHASAITRMEGPPSVVW